VVGTCPSDLFLPSTTSCRAPAGVCDAEETCTGSSATCPPDAFEPNTTECRASSGPVCDPAEFCTGSSDDCPPDAFGRNSSVGFTARGAKSGGSVTTMSWTGEVEPGPYNVYRGAKRAGDDWVYNQGCVLPNTTSQSVNDPAVPQTMMTYYYLVTRVRPPCDESSLGEDSDSNERPNDNPCLSPGDDTDGDGVVDYQDNCYLFYNPLQIDVDNDSYGDDCDNCPTVSNRNQADADNDNVGDACEN
jgi:hypothetical protein